MRTIPLIRLLQFAFMVLVGCVCLGINVAKAQINLKLSFNDSLPHPAERAILMAYSSKAGQTAAFELQVSDSNGNVIATNHSDSVKLGRGLHTLSGLFAGQSDSAASPGMELLYHIRAFSGAKAVGSVERKVIFERMKLKVVLDSSESSWSWNPYRTNHPGDSIHYQLSWSEARSSSNPTEKGRLKRLLKRPPSVSGRAEPSRKSGTSQSAPASGQQSNTLLLRDTTFSPLSHTPNFDSGQVYQWQVQVLRNGQLVAESPLQEDTFLPLDSAETEGPKKRKPSKDSLSFWPDPLKPNARFTGFAMLEGYVSNQQFTFNQQPPSYARWYFQPGFQAYGVPLVLDAFVTTESGNQRMNSATLRFDQQTFRNNIGSDLQNRLQSDNNQHRGTPGLPNDFSPAQLPNAELQLEQLKQQGNPADTSLLDRQIGELQWKLAHGDSSNMEADTARLAELRAKRQQLTQLQGQTEQTEQRIEQLKQAQKKYDQLNAQGIERTNYSASDLSDTEFLKKNFHKTGNHGFLKPLLDLESMGVGNVNPYYSDLTIMGTTVQGADIEVTPGAFYLHATHGRLLNPYRMANQQENAFSDRMTAAQLGWGEVSEEHVHLRMMSARSDNPEPTYFSRPDRNHMLGIDIAKDLGHNLMLGIEANQSSASFRDVETETPSSFQRNLRSLDLDRSAMQTQLEFQPTDLSLNLKTRYYRLGNGYHSLAAPFLRTDLHGWQLEGSKGVFADRLSLLAGIERQEDNLSGTRFATMKIQTLRFGASTQLAKFPNINVLYTPVTMHYTSPVHNNVRNMHLLSSTLSYITRWRQTTIASNLNHTYSGTRVEGDNFQAEPVNFHASTLTEQVTFPSGTQAGLMATYVQPTSGPIIQPSGNGEAYTSFMIQRKVRATIGTNLAFNTNRSIRSGGYVQAEFRALKKISFMIRSGLNRYQGYTTMTRANELFTHATAQYTW